MKMFVMLLLTTAPGSNKGLRGILTKIVFILLLLLPTMTSAETQSDKLAGLFVGRWVGTWTYQKADADEKTGSRPAILTRGAWVTAELGKRPNVLRMTTYLDENNNVTHDVIDIVFDVEHGKIVYRYEHEEADEVFTRIAGLDEFLTKGEGQIVLSRQDRETRGTERMTITLTRSLFMRERERSAKADGPIDSVQRVLLTRDQPPQKK